MDEFRKRLNEIIETSEYSDKAGRTYDIVSVIIVVINLLVSIMYTYESLRTAYGRALLTIESITVLFFAVDYILRLVSCKFKYSGLSEPKAILKYISSFTGVVDLLSFLPYYLPFFFPSGAVAFRMFRVVRIFRLFRINAYYDSLNVITTVIKNKRQQLLSSVFILAVLMMASSLCMYSLEHEAQPDVFQNAFSGMWWSVSTLLTVGYGDIYPITPMGKFFSIIITFLGVGMVAIPTGILSAGFVEQYQRIKRISEYGEDVGLNFIAVTISNKDKCIGKALKDLNIPKNVIIAAIKRGPDELIPRGDTILLAGDVLIVAAERLKNLENIEMKEVILKEQHPWNGLPIRDLDISRRTIIVMVQRKNKTLIPSGDLVLQKNDRVVLYEKGRAQYKSM